MNKLFFTTLLALFLFTTPKLHSQRFDWSASGGYAGVANSVVGAQDIAQDKAGNIFIINPANTSVKCQDVVVPLVSAGSSTNGFLHKFNNQGKLLWIKAIGKSVTVLGLECDEVGSVYVLVSVADDSIVGADFGFKVASHGNHVVKFNKDGDFIWHSPTGTPFSSAANCNLLLYRNGMIYFQSSGTAISSMDTTGKTLGTLPATSYVPQTAQPSIYFKSAVELSTGDLVFVGEHRGRLSFGLDTVPNSMEEAKADRMVFLRATPTLQVVWSKSYGSFRPTFGPAIGICRDELDNVYASVLIPQNSPVIFGPDTVLNTTAFGGVAAFIKMDSSGVPLWLRSVRGGQGSAGHGMLWKDGAGSLLVCGDYVSEVEIGNVKLLSSGDGGGFICEIDSSGSFVTAYSSAKASSSPSALQAFPFALAKTVNGKYLVSGKLSTLSPYIQSCQTYPDNRGFFLSSFSGEPDVAPKPTISISGTTLTASPVFRGKIQWYFDGEPIVGANGQILEATASGKYSVEYKYTDFCVNSDTSTALLVTTDVSDDRDKDGVTVSPNPFADVLSISNLSGATQKVNLYSIDGSKVIEIFNPAAAGLSLNTSSLPYGVYFLTIQYTDTISTVRLIKSR